MHKEMNIWRTISVLNIRYMIWYQSPQCLTYIAPQAIQRYLQICTAMKYMDHLMKEATEIQLHPNNFNRDEGFSLSHTWCPVINMLKRYSGERMEKESQAQIGTWLYPLASYWLASMITNCLGHCGFQYHITSLMMGIKMVLETSVSFIHLIRLMVWEDFIEFCRRESFKSFFTK
jgi:hypothetical protein